MPKERIALTREKLYEQVWSEPIVHVARRLGLSGRGLGKLCARYEIPVPPRGWWAKKRHGHAVRRILLPPSHDTATDIVFQPGEAQPQLDEPREVERERDPAWLISVPEDLVVSHRLVKQAASAARKASREIKKDGVVRWQDRYQAKLVKPGAGHVDIAVSKASLPRASRIMQALLVAFDRRGFAIRVTEKNETFVTVLGEAFQIALVERLKQVTVKHTYGNRVELEPSGRLMLRIGSSYHNSGVSDSPSRRIENSLNRFVVNLVRRALEAKRARVVPMGHRGTCRSNDEPLRASRMPRSIANSPHSSGCSTSPSKRGS